MGFISQKQLLSKNDDKICSSTVVYICILIWSWLNQFRFHAIPVHLLLSSFVRTYVGDLLQMLEQEDKHGDEDCTYKNFKACVNMLSFRFDSPPPVYPNPMQMG
jgi:hypothetical protein